MHLHPSILYTSKSRDHIWRIILLFSVTNNPPLSVGAENFVKSSGSCSSIIGRVKKVQWLLDCQSFTPKVGVKGKHPLEEVTYYKAFMVYFMCISLRHTNVYIQYSYRALCRVSVSYLFMHASVSTFVLVIKQQ